MLQQIVTLTLTIAIHVVSADPTNPTTCSGIIPRDFLITLNQSTSCLVECNNFYPNGTTSFSCFAFSDGVQAGMAKDGLFPKEACTTTQFETPGENPNTTDTEMSFTACPQWSLFVGWDRSNEAHTMGKMRQELVLKTPQAMLIAAKILNK